MIGLEESHGYLIGSYARDKDSAPPAIMLCELAAKLKKDGRTIIDYLHDIYRQYGYYGNLLCNISWAERRAEPKSR